VAVWCREVDAGWHAAWGEESARGYPTLLRRLRGTAFSLPGVTPGGYIDNTTPVLRHILGCY
jgi:hypothetical protein